MKEFLLLIRAQEEHCVNKSAEEQQQHVQKVIAYMGGLMKSNNLKSAQPLEMEGVLISGSGGKLKDGPFNETKEVIAGYFLLQAESLEEAVEIAKNNPILDDGYGARIEVRPIKVIEGING